MILDGGRTGGQCEFNSRSLCITTACARVVATSSQSRISPYYDTSHSLKPSTKMRSIEDSVDFLRSHMSSRSGLSDPEVSFNPYAMFDAMEHRLEYGLQNGLEYSSSDDLSYCNKVSIASVPLSLSSLTDLLTVHIFAGK